MINSGTNINDIEAKLKDLSESYNNGNKKAYTILLTGDIPVFSLRPNDLLSHMDVVNTIHKYNSEHPNENVKEAFENGLDTAIKIATHFYQVCNLMRVLLFEAEIEKGSVFRKNKSFSIEVQSFLDKLCKRINKKRRRLIKQYPNFNNWASQSTIRARALGLTVNIKY